MGRVGAGHTSERYHSKGSLFFLFIVFLLSYFSTVGLYDVCWLQLRARKHIRTMDAGICTLQTNRRMNKRTKTIDYIIDVRGG